MTVTPSAKPPEEMAFEEAMAALEAVVNQLERGDVKLDESISLYERGAKLKKRCEDLLKDAQEKVEKIRLAEGRVVGAEPVTGL
ncbi:exodeoxyribonuclease VII small subunit [Xinfangfangia sp. CPCC 101601]|uniref:Exodeoxyribonuclease 7 small subunit n=1 Tax=Pseudogemmobacter lacusdianii TaxID=3069608 RepID=A0ABU0VXV0_9RHOB|nr:exodeoxyribonuclease VII small subunit [Xinfangfangia sp. CPCC 101601]MDQ2066558.1 exodeoxyribonuclease VII small subunit [Xinfangfangia sp. CPCC 101601]